MEQTRARFINPLNARIAAGLATVVMFVAFFFPVGTASASQSAVGQVPPGTFIVPASGKIFGYVGGYCDGTIDTGAPHAAWDISNSSGGAIGASSGGTVIFAGLSNSNLGYRVVISHSNGWETSYSHLLSNVQVSSGNSVSAGQTIGYMGGTGTGGATQYAVHLHFELRYNGTAQSDWNSYFTCLKTVARGDTISGSGASITNNTVLAPGDWDGDGFSDVLHVQPAALYLYRGNGSGGFINGAGIVVATGWWGLRVITPGDWDGDGHPDLLAIDGSGSLWLYRGNGTGGFVSNNGTLLATNWGGLEHIVAPGDWDGDGHRDLIVVDNGGQLWLYRGNGTGGFASNNGTLLATGWGGYPRFATPGDFSGDGEPDLLLGETNGNLWLYRGNGTGGFASNNGALVGSGWTFREVVATPDFNGTGTSDVFGVTNAGAMYLYPGSGSGTFLAPWIALGSGW